MMIRNMTAAALSLGVLLSASGTATAAPKKDTLSLALTGTAAGGVTFAGTLHIQKFVAREGRVMAIVLVEGSATSALGAPLGSTLTGPLAVPVTAEPGGQAAAGERPQNAQRQPCDLLHLEVGAIDLNVLGLQVTTMPVSIDLSGEEGGVLGQLVCTILETLGNVVGLVGLLNQLLGLLGGLV